MRKVISSTRPAVKIVIGWLMTITILGIACLEYTYAQGCAGSGSPYCQDDTPVPCQDVAQGKCMTFDFFKVEYDYGEDAPTCNGVQATNVKVISAASWTTCEVSNNDSSECSCQPSGCQVAKFYTGANCAQADYCGGNFDQMREESLGTGALCYEPGPPQGNGGDN